MGFKIVLTSVSLVGSDPVREATIQHEKKIEALKRAGWEIRGTRIAFCESGSITCFMTTAERDEE